MNDPTTPAEGYRYQVERSDMPPPPAYPYQYRQVTGAGNPLAVTSMILGIASLLFWWWGLVDLGGLVVLSIVFGSVGVKRANAGASGHGMAVAGLVCGIIGAFGYLIWGIATLGVGFLI